MIICKLVHACCVFYARINIIIELVGGATLDVEIWIPVIIGIVCLAAGSVVGYIYRRNIAEAKIANAEEAV